MTKREFLQAVINSEGVAVNVKDFAKNEIQKMDEKNLNRSSKPTAAQLVNEGIKEQILSVLTVEPMVSSAVAEKIGISTQKASALCRQLVDSGKAHAVEVKLPKKGKQQGYFIDAPTDEVAEEVTEEVTE